MSPLAAVGRLLSIFQVFTSKFSPISLFDFLRNHNSEGEIAQDPPQWESVANASRVANQFRYQLLPYLYRLGMQIILCLNWIIVFVIYIQQHLTSKHHQLTSRIFPFFANNQKFFQNSWSYLYQYFLSFFAIFIHFQFAFSRLQIRRYCCSSTVLRVSRRFDPLWPESSVPVGSQCDGRPCFGPWGWLELFFLKIFRFIFRSIRSEPTSPRSPLGIPLAMPINMAAGSNPVDSIRSKRQKTHRCRHFCAVNSNLKFKVAFLLL